MAKIICDCGNTLETCEEGVNDSDFFKCEKCGDCYNVIYGKEEVED